jgi:hypothetical protein
MIVVVSISIKYYIIIIITPPLPPPSISLGCVFRCMLVPDNLGRAATLQ